MKSREQSHLALGSLKRHLHRVLAELHPCRQVFENDDGVECLRIEAGKQGTRGLNGQPAADDIVECDLGLDAAVHAEQIAALESLRSLAEHAGRESRALAGFVPIDKDSPAARRPLVGLAYTVRHNPRAWMIVGKNTRKPLR